MVQLAELASEWAGRANFIAVCFDEGLSDESRQIAQKYGDEIAKSGFMAHVYGKQPASLHLEYIPHKVYVNSAGFVVRNYENCNWKTELHSELDS